MVFMNGESNCSFDGQQHLRVGRKACLAKLNSFAVRIGWAQRLDENINTLLMKLISGSSLVGLDTGQAKEDSDPDIFRQIPLGNWPVLAGSFQLLS